MNIIYYIEPNVFIMSEDKKKEVHRRVHVKWVKVIVLY